MTKSAEPSTPSGSSETQQRRRQITSYKNTTTSPAPDTSDLRRRGDCGGRLAMPSVRLAATWAAKVDVDVEAMITLMRGAGTSRFIDAMLNLCHKSVGA